MRNIISLLLILFIAGTTEAQLQTDIRLWQLLSPAGGNTPDCLNNNNVPVTVIYENVGIDTLYNIPVSYQLDGGAIVNDTLPYAERGLFHLFTFFMPVDVSSQGTHTLKCWTSAGNDMDLTNDTVTTALTLVPGILLQLPLFETFESYSTCDTTANCDATSCYASAQWKNNLNGMDDGIDFRVNSGSTPTDSTGPDADHTIGDSTGKYIYLESTNCFNQTALLTSECIDLTTAITPELRFRYHLFGAGMGSLSVQIYSHGRWYSNQIPPINGNLGNQWYEQPLNLTPFIGDIILIQFIATTGADSSGTSDLAIDDILISEPGVAPMALFTADSTTGCAGKIVSFTDLTAYNPLTWQWKITPNTFTFQNGTDSTSQNPIIQFNATADYTIQLNVANYFGKDSITFSDYISIVQPASLPVTENFESGIFPPAHWNNSLSNEYDWDTLTVIGSSGTPTVAVWSNNYNNYATSTEDFLSTFPIDLSGIIAPQLTFDVAYAWYNLNNIDGLRLEISTNCGSNFYPTGYLKTDSALATVPSQLSEFFPTQSTHWRRDTVMLFNWTASEALLRFVNMNGYGNNLFIDNIQIQSAVSINKIYPAPILHAYPNPASKFVIVEFESNTSEKVRLEILDFQGKVIYSEKIQEHGAVQKVLDLEIFPAGIYLLRVSSSEYTQACRIVRVE